MLDVVIDPIHQHLYWSQESNPGGIFRANLDGTNTVPLVSGIAFPRSLAIDFEHTEIYWITPSLVQRAALDGTNQETVVTDLFAGTGLAIYTPVPEPNTLTALAAGIGMLQLLARRGTRSKRRQFAS